MRTCSVCELGERPQIDALLAAGSSIRSVARLHSLSRTTLSRHAAHARDLPRRFALISGTADPSGPVDPLAAGFELAARAKTERERLKSLEAIRGATALLLRSSQGEPDAEAARQLDRNVAEAAEAFRSGSSSFEQSIRALQGLREAIRQKLDARRAPDAVQVPLEVANSDGEPIGGAPIWMAPAAYWRNVPARFRDPAAYVVERTIKLQFAAVRQSNGHAPAQEVKVREIATGALAWSAD